MQVCTRERIYESYWTVRQIWDADFMHQESCLPCPSQPVTQNLGVRSLCYFRGYVPILDVVQQYIINKVFSESVTNQICLLYFKTWFI